MTRTLSTAQLNALRSFARANGPRWRLALNDAWSTGNYHRYSGAGDSASLQQIRNTFGPTWLTVFSFGKPKTHRTLEYCDGCDEHGRVLTSYTVTHHDGKISSPTRYCRDCAALARADWNGETKSIQPIKET